MCHLSRTQRNPQDHIAALRHSHLAPFVDACRAIIKTRLLLHHDGERLYRVLERRYGFDDVAPATLVACGLEMGLSRERVRQLEDTAVAYCSRRRMAWPEALGEIAARFVGEPASCADEAVQAAQPDLSSVHCASEGMSDTIAGHDDPRSPTSVPLYTREEIGTMVVAIEGRVGKPLGCTTIARVLVGHPGPEVKALVAQHGLPHYGVLKGLPRGEVGRLIEALRLRPTTPGGVSP